MVSIHTEAVQTFSRTSEVPKFNVVLHVVLNLVLPRSLVIVNAAVPGVVCSFSKCVLRLGSSQDPACDLPSQQQNHFGHTKTVRTLGSCCCLVVQVSFS